MEDYAEKCKIYLQIFLQNNLSRRHMKLRKAARVDAGTYLVGEEHNSTILTIKEWLLEGSVKFCQETMWMEQRSDRPSAWCLLIGQSQKQPITSQVFNHVVCISQLKCTTRRSGDLTGASITSDFRRVFSDLEIIQIKFFRFLNFFTCFSLLFSIVVYLKSGAK